jgi:predicted house-cleaning noncanonical NTP pyrophosphatase (MazG superfamily)
VGEFSKLVRDRIPQIIRADGAEPATCTAGPEEYRSRLRDKLGEEVADVLEVVRALAADLGVDVDQLEKIRQTKASERGGFADRIVWRGNR